MPKRHIIFYKLLRPLFPLFLFIKFGYRYKKAGKLPGNYLVLSNHNTDFDFLMVASSFSEHMYFVGSEHIARWKKLYAIITYCFGLVTRSKGTTASSTVLEMLRLLRGGNNVCLFAEGARSWDGVTGPILASTGKILKKAKCGLVTYRIEGGYFASPRWSVRTRRGRVYGAPVNFYSVEQLSAMTAEEINAAINRDLYEDAYARQLEAPAAYRGKGLAEGMENLLFLCPQCGSMDTIRSQNDTVSCTDCDMTFRYDSNGMLVDAPFRTVKELADWQKEKVTEAACANTTFTVPSAILRRVENHEETVLAQGPVSMDAEALICGDVTIPMDTITHFDIHGKRGLVFSTTDGYYELKPEAPANALKFLLLHNAHKELTKVR